MNDKDILCVRTNRRFMIGLCSDRIRRSLNKINLDIHILRRMYNVSNNLVFLTDICCELIKLDDSEYALSDNTTTKLLRSIHSKLHQLLKTDDINRDLIVRFIQRLSYSESNLDEVYRDYLTYCAEEFTHKALDQSFFAVYLNVCIMIAILVS